MSEPGRQSEPVTREFVAFRAGNQEFCMDIMAVREIRSALPVTPLPRTPPYIRGLINLRGAVLPIMDFATRVGLPAADPTAQSVTIVVWTGSQLVGLEVDSVSDIIAVDQTAIQAAPEIAIDGLQQFVRAVMTVEGRMVCVIGVEDLLPKDEVDAA